MTLSAMNPGASQFRPGSAPKVQHSNGVVTPPNGLQDTEKKPTSNGSLPPHLRAAAAKSNGTTASTPPHLRKKNPNNPLVTDGNVDAMPILRRHAPEPTPPPSPTTSFNPDVPRQSIEEPYTIHSGKGWMPYAVANLPPLDSEQLSQIPATKDAVSFSYDFLCNQIGGAFWSPGLKYVPPNLGSCVVRSRSYYLFDAKVEPYLPREPGQHGAKLTAFFNSNPEEMYGEQAAGSFGDVPMFVATGDSNRYVYYGNYSQTRWSDKLDYDRMREMVPESVKLYWAEELSASGRAEWVTKALKKHFFPMPEYEGQIVKRRGEGGAELEDDDKAEFTAKALNDVKKYVSLLRDWDEEATLKTKLIKKEFILQAFDRADADDGLRLWWEYLQCTKWDSEFYKLLVDLQRREHHYL